MGFWKLSVKIFQDAVGPKLFSSRTNFLSYKMLNIRHQIVVRIDSATSTGFLLVLKSTLVKFQAQLKLKARGLFFF